MKRVGTTPADFHLSVGVLKQVFTHVSLGCSVRASTARGQAAIAGSVSQRVILTAETVS